MDTQQPAALRTGPPLLFVSDELPYAKLFHVNEIVYHAHSISGSITFIQMIQCIAGKPLTVKAVADFALPHLPAVFDFTCNAGFWFGAVVAAAAGT